MYCNTNSCCVDIISDMKTMKPMERASWVRIGFDPIGTSTWHWSVTVQNSVVSLQLYSQLSNFQSKILPLLGHVSTG